MTAYRMAALKRLPNVELINDVELTAVEIERNGADAVVLATGSHWATDGLNALHARAASRAPRQSPRTCSRPSRSCSRASARAPGRIVVYDGDGYLVAGALAELLAREGREVELVTGYDDDRAVLRRDARGRARARAPARVRRRHAHRHGADGASTPGSLTLRRRRRRAARAARPPASCSSPSASRTTRSSTSSTAAAQAVFRIGDCVAPRLLAEAVFDGHRLAREIDCDDPEVALPYLRERVGDSDELPPAPDACAAGLPAAAARARAARLRVHRGRGRCGRAHRRAAARGRARRRSSRWAAARATRSSAAGRWPSATERAWRSRGRRSRPAARRARSWWAPRATRSPRAPTWLSASRARCRTSSAWPDSADRRGRQSRPRGAHLRARRSRRGRRRRRAGRRAARAHRAGGTGALNPFASPPGGIPPFRH